MATTSIERSPGASGGLRQLVASCSTGAIVLAAAIPFLFVHEQYHPSLTIDAGASVELRLSDLAVLAVLVAAAVEVRTGAGRLRAGLPLWIAGAALLAWLAFQVLRPASLDDPGFDDHLVSYLKLVQYALLALAVPLLVKRSRDLALVLGVVVSWGAVASSVAVAQFFGLDVLDAWNPGWRQPSFLGHHDLAALAAIGLALALTGIVAGRASIPAAPLFWLALAAGGVGVILAGSVAAAGGLAIGALALWAAARLRFRPSGRQTLALALTVGVVALGVLAVRDADVGNFLRFLGIRGDDQAQGVESYSQRTVLAYIGLRIAQDNPLVGVGWQRSSTPEVFLPYVPDARERFPDVVDLAFPSENRRWGVQNLYIHMLADAGVIGLSLLLLVGATGVLLAWRAAARAPTSWATGAGLVSLCALLTIGSEWASLGIVAGIPLQAASCLLLGLAAAGAAFADSPGAGDTRPREAPHGERPGGRPLG